LLSAKTCGFTAMPALLSRTRSRLGGTDAVSKKPDISAPFLVHCPDCGKRYSYGVDEVLKVESGVRESFTPHPLFRDS
jgi:hypothetical protein